jgi:predicted ATPase
MGRPVFAVRGSSVVRTSSRTPTVRVSVRQGGCVHVADRMQECVSQVMHARRQEVVCMLVQEGWTYDSDERRALVDKLVCM